MKAVANLKIGLRLALCLGVIVLMLGVVVAVGVTRLTSLDGEIKTLVENRQPKVAALEEIAYRAMDNTRIVRNLVLLTDDKAKAANKEAFDKNVAAIGEQLAFLDKHLASPDDKERLKEIVAARSAFLDYTKEVVALAMAGKSKEAVAALYGSNYASQATYFVALRKLADSQKTKMAEASAEAGEVYLAAFKLMVAAGLAAALLSAVLGWLITRSITRPLTRAVKVADAIADGKFDNVIDAGAKDETGTLLTALQRMQQSLREREVRDADFRGQIAAVNKAQAVIEFNLDGTVVSANENFLKTLGYTLTEIQGQHHGMFVEPAYRASGDYRAFWDRLGRGEHDAGQYKRIGKGGKEVWIQASYNPILGPDGKPFKVVKYATDITEAKLKSADYEGQLSAISKAQAVIEFNLDGTVRTANENFCKTLGYTLEEIKGKHHRMFAEPSYAASAEYLGFWSKLGRGEYDAGQYKRVAKGGREIWIQASYNPIVGPDGKPFKVVKYATDITAEKLRNADFEGQLVAIGKAQAVIEFRLDGTILDANENFCKTLGYTLEEIKGKHHSMFAERSYAASPEYRAFWDKLGRGEYDAGQYKRFGKGGKEVWIQASYNPILDMNGKPFKVVKYATDITEQVLGANDMARVLGALAKGDLTETVTNDYSGSFKQVKADANAAVAQLNQIIGQIIESTEAINTAAMEIASGNTDLSQRTEEQASSLEETASSMEELTSTVKQNADNAKQANQLAATASEVAIKGGQVVSQVVTTMSSIAESSKKIVDIISVIDGIAFQTNILALNAAVEAARAGEQGRGFAVVASEVRSLAQRSAAAAKEIKTLIGDSVEKVEAGSKLVGSAGQQMEDIVGSVKRVTDIMSEITAASQEQSAGIEQVNQAITQMDQVTQQNAALVEEAAAASESMKQQAVALSSAVATFKLQGETGAAWDGAERRGPNRATNVSRIASPPKAAQGRPAAASKAAPSKRVAAAQVEKATGTDGGEGDWESF